VILLLAALTLVGFGAAIHTLRLTNAQPVKPSPSTSAENLVMTSGVETQLIAAAAKINGNVPVSEFKGLEPREVHYAYDPATGTYWAAASLLPRDDSSAAAVAVQDNGSYNVFRRRVGGTWTAYDVGLAGVGGTQCPLTVPPTVLRLWGWPSNSCRPGPPS
jgi:hypothetical protein